MHSLLHYIFASTVNPFWGVYILWVSDFLAFFSVPSILLRRAGNPISALSWLLAVFAIPYLGVLLWWILGRTHLKRKIIRRERTSENFSHCLEGQQDDNHFPSFTDYFSTMPVSLESNAELSLLATGGDAFSAMESAIETATKTLFLMFYIWKVDETGKRWVALLDSAARRGVNVYILVDAAGSRAFIACYAKKLRTAGCKVAASNDPKLALLASNINFRNHRKLLVVDECLGYMGGMNIGSEYQQQWLDLMIRVTGPVVERLTAVFAEEWYHATTELIPLWRGFCNHCQKPLNDGDSRISPATHKARCYVIDSGPHKMINDTQDALFMAINAAKERIYITTPYFIPSISITAALKVAARRGVDIIILVPRKSDVPLVSYASRTYFSELLAGKIRIFEYEYRKIVLHRKTVIIDEHLSLLGSANVDIRSFKLNFELSLLIHSESVNRELVKFFQENLLCSKEVAECDIRRRHGCRALADSVAHLLSPLL